ncbi:MAG TPA: hypothetical protein VK586_19330 [Streptosporangiaceae bacterium]|nr:hypothetical protein [Streptosporangiaceae bacterium]
MPAPAPAPATIDTVIAMLESLGAELAAAGWTARLQVAPGRAPALYVQNPEPGAAALSEHVYAAPKDDGLWFWWSWGEPIAQGIPEAAALIRRALRAAPEFT